MRAALIKNMKSRVTIVEKGSVWSHLVTFPPLIRHMVARHKDMTKSRDPIKCCNGYSGVKVVMISLVSVFVIML